MFYENDIRETLIKACHSSDEADQFFRSQLDKPELLELLVRIAKDDDDYAGDAPMTAAYYASEFPPRMLEQHEQTLREMLPSVNGYGGHVAVALGKTRSPVGRQLRGAGTSSLIGIHVAQREYLVANPKPISPHPLSPEEALRRAMSVPAPKSEPKPGKAVKKVKRKKASR